MQSIHFLFWIGLHVRPMAGWHEDVMVVISHLHRAQYILSLPAVHCTTEKRASKNRLSVPKGLRDTFKHLSHLEVVPFPSGKTNQQLERYTTVEQINITAAPFSHFLLLKADIIMKF